MKKILFIVLTFFCLFLVSDKVYADRLGYSNTEIECIYADGITVGTKRSVSFDENGDRNVSQKIVFGKSKIAVPLVSLSIETQMTNTLDVELATAKFSQTNDGVFSCPESIDMFLRVARQGSSNVYEALYTYKESIKYEEVTGYSKTWHEWLTGSNAEYSLIKLGVKDESDTNFYKWIDLKNNSGTVTYTQSRIRYSLISERMSIVDELPDEQYGPVFELVDTNEQATSSKKYAQFYRSKSYNTTTGAIHWHLQIGTTITSVKENIDISGKDKEICILESIGVQDAESVELGNKYNSSRHRVKNINEDGSCDAGYEKYKKTTRVCEIDAKNPAGSFCDKFPKTAFQLANIVNILQILVPALVIIFTGVEIGKIVIAGNVEEELPKRKQSIIIRLIIMVVFLFLRLIVSLIIALANGVMIADVGCLFEDGINETEGNELKCYNESDDSQ